MNRKAGTGTTAAKKTANRKTGTEKDTSGNRYKGSAGSALLAPSGKHLIVGKRSPEFVMRAIDGPPGSRHHPSLFDRAIETFL